MLGVKLIPVSNRATLARMCLRIHLLGGFPNFELTSVFHAISFESSSTGPGGALLLSFPSKWRAKASENGKRNYQYNSYKKEMSRQHTNS